MRLWLSVKLRSWLSSLEAARRLVSSHGVGFRLQDRCCLAPVVAETSPARLG